MKIRDHEREAAVFITLLEERLTALGTQPEIRAEFMKEMRRFLPASLVRDTLERDSYWAYLTRVVTESGRKAVALCKRKLVRGGKTVPAAKSGEAVRLPRFGGWHLYVPSWGRP
jgi:hypothetical protein